MPDGTASSIWYVVSTHGREGPLSVAVIQERVREGTLMSSDLAWRTGMENWRKISDITELQVLELLDEESHTQDESAPVQDFPPSEDSESDGEENSDSDESPDGANLQTSEASENLESQDMLVPADLEPDDEATQIIRRPPSAGDSYEQSQEAIGLIPATDFEKMESDVAAPPVHKDERKGRDRRSSERRQDKRRVEEAPKGANRGTKRSIRPFGPVALTPVGTIVLSQRQRPRSLFKTIWIALGAGLICYGLLTWAPSDFFSPLTQSHRSTHLKDLTDSENEAIKFAIDVPLEKFGQKFEVVHKTVESGAHRFIVATNLEDGVSFSIFFHPIAATLVGDEASVPPLKIVVKDHIAEGILEKAVPGYYLVSLHFSQNSKELWKDRVFLGGAPDLTYQTRLKDFNAERRGTVRAEVDRIKPSLQGLREMFLNEQRLVGLIQKQKWTATDDRTWQAYMKSVELAEQRISQSIVPTYKALPVTQKRVKLLLERHQVFKAQVTALLRAAGAQLLKRSSGSPFPIAQKSAEALEYARTMLLPPLDDAKARVDSAEKALADPSIALTSETDWDAVGTRN